MKINPLLLLGLVIVLLVGCQPASENTTTNRGALGDSAMIVTAHPIATQVGLSVLKAGGNVVDAAVASHFALTVVYPRAGNIGGGGFAVLRMADGVVDGLDFREKAPMTAHRTMYQNEQGEVNPELSTLGHMAVGVPGSVAGMWQLHQKYGSMEWAKLVQPAIDIAFEGHRITEDEAATLNEKQEDFIQGNTHTPWVVKEGGWSAGDPVNQPQLAATLSFIRDSGRDGFYTGIVASQIVDEMKTANGLITHEDLQAYEAIWRKPLITSYKEHTIIGMAPPSSGGVAVAQLLQGAEQLQLTQHPHNSVQAVHLMAELERRVFADRAEYLGDPDFTNVPVSTLTSPAYNEERFGTIALDKATPSDQVAAGEAMAESTETTHYSIVDKYGNALAVTTTLNGNYGSKVMVKGAGFFLNNEMDDFSAKPGVPNMFGLVGAEANAIAPQKRMLSSMTPTIVTTDGELRAVVGTPGGATIITSVFQTILNILDYNMTMQDAVAAKKIHHQWLPDRILVEKGALDQKQISTLEEMGHNIEFREKIGRTDCILVLENGQLEGGADPRGDDYAEGF
ncbi:gamma-glutamyltransferase [Marinoscillum furvescens]|uniref:Glutathione hydrolase proenzyme n=1 Tax=Marinoscillum furvescens DSM 4134 TaxID=1122208 RepID=A0A3D9L1P7_MARFU|nr:gamma-glutamyltransferase [Marinoscillum furvescens]RED95657.1 gamma-glutamyltranspeptidase/glutathione hydrolase [Marinoscillum furvescens DSM 4134]